MFSLKIISPPLSLKIILSSDVKTVLDFICLHGRKKERLIFLLESIKINA